MKKFFMIVLAVVIGLAFVTTTFAQAPAPEKKAEKAAVAADTDKAAGDKAPADAKEKKPPKKAKKKAPKKQKEEKKEEAAPAPAK
jgi:hypothetical protein